MQKPRQLRNYEKGTESWQRRGETSCSKDSQESFSPFGKWRERNSTPKKDIGQYQGPPNRRFNGQAPTAQHNKIIRQTFRNGRKKRTMELLEDELHPSPSLDLKISNSNAEYTGEEVSSPTLHFEAATPFTLGNLRDETPEAMMFEDQALPESIHQTEGSARSSTHTAEQFKTPNAGEGKSDFGGFDTSFKQSIAKKINKKVPKFDGTHLESCEQHLEKILNAEGNSSKEERQVPLNNFQNSFESFNGSRLYTDGQDARHQASTETVLDTSLMQSWSVQTAGTVADRDAGEKEPGVPNQSMEIDVSQDGGLRINCEPVYTSNAEETTTSGVGENVTPYLPMEEPNSAGSFGHGASRRSGNIIAMGRQSKIISNILNSGQFIKQKRTGSSQGNGRTPINQKQYSTEKRPSITMPKFELQNCGLPAQIQKRMVSRNADYHDQHKTLPATKRPMEPMIIQRPAGQKQKTSRNINNTIDNRLESKFSRNLARSRVNSVNSQSQTRVTGAQISTTEVAFTTSRKPTSTSSSYFKPAQMNNQKQELKTISQPQQRVKKHLISFTGLTMDQLAKRRSSKTKKKSIKQEERISVMPQNAFQQKKRSQDFEKLYFSGFSVRNGEQRYRNQTRQLQKEMKKSNLNVEPRTNSGQRDLQSKVVKKQRKARIAGGISEYIKMLKSTDLARSDVRSTVEMSENAYANNAMAHRNRFRSVSSVKSLSAHSMEKSSNNKANGSVVLAQEYKSLRANKSNSRTSSATRPINILNNSAYSLHSSLSAALSRKQLARIQEGGSRLGSRNNSNSQKSSFKASAVMSQDHLNLSSSLHHVPEHAGLRNNKYQPCSTKNHPSRSRLMEDSPSYGHFQSTSSLAGTFEDQATIQEKERIEQEKLQKFQRAKQRANSYIRKDSAQKSLEQQQQQQQRIQKKLFQRYRIDEESNEGRTTEQTTEKERPQEKEIDVVLIKTPEKLTKQRRSNITPDQKKSYQKLSTSVKFLKYNLGAILKGYKARQVYRKNALIQQYRAEFRDQVQFEIYLQLQVYRINLQLKRFVRDPILEVQRNYTNQTHLNTVNQMKSLRQKFTEQFDSTMESDEWLKACTATEVSNLAKSGKSSNNCMSPGNFESMKSSYLRDMEAKVQESNLAHATDNEPAESQRTLSCTQQAPDQNPSASKLSCMLSSIQHLQTVTEIMTETDTTVVEVKVDGTFKEAPNGREEKKGKSYMSPTKCSMAKRRTDESARLFPSPCHDKTLDLSLATVSRQRASILQKSSKKAQTPERTQSFVSKIPRCTSSVKKASQPTYPQGPTRIPKLNLGLLNNSQTRSGETINLTNQNQQASVQSKKSAGSSRQNASVEASSFDVKLSQIKKQSCDLKRSVLSFNCTANFENFRLPPADEESQNKTQLGAVTIIEEAASSNDGAQNALLSGKPCSDISQCREQRFTAPRAVEAGSQEPGDQQFVDKMQNVLIMKTQSSMFSKGNSQMSSLSKRSNNSKQSERKELSSYHEQKMASNKKYQHRKVAGESLSPQAKLKNISVTNFKLPKQSGNKGKISPNKENLRSALTTVPSSVPASIPVSAGGARRLRNDRSATKIDKPIKKVAPSVPFSECDTNSPMKLRIAQPSPKSEKSQVQIKQTVNQIQEMISKLQEKKSENKALSMGEQVYKAQFEQMMDDLKNQFQMLTQE